MPNKDSLDIAANRRGLKVLRTSNDSPVDAARDGGTGRCQCARHHTAPLSLATCRAMPRDCSLTPKFVRWHPSGFRLPRLRRNSYYDSDGEEIPEPTKV